MAGSPGEKLRDILIVEDNPVISTVLRRHIEKDAALQLHVRVARDGLVGFQESSARRPDLVLLDLNMPNYDGRAFLELFQKEPTLQGVPVLVYSAADAATLRKVIEEFPFVKVLQKPISPTQLVKRLLENLTS